MPNNMLYDQVSAKATGSGKKKGAAESKEQEIKDLGKMPGDEKQMDTPARKKGGAKKDMMEDEKMSGGGRKKGSAKHIDGTDKGHDAKPDFPDVDGDGDKKEPLKKAAKEAKQTETVSKPGASRMGFTQNFGPARQNSYARGAAKVASIMGKGAFKKKGAADDTGSPHTHSMDQGSINSMRSQMGDFEGTQGGGGYANRENYSSYRKSSKSLPKGVIQDYVGQGGSTNPSIAKGELQSVLNKTKAGFGGSGTSSNEPFKSSEAHDPRAYYAPDKPVVGIDPQTGKNQTYQDFYAAPNVNKFSTAFQSNIGETLKLRKQGVNEGIKSKGIAAVGGIKAPLLGASKKPHAKKKKY